VVINPDEERSSKAVHGALKELKPLPEIDHCPRVEHHASSDGQAAVPAAEGVHYVGGDRSSKVIRATGGQQCAQLIGVPSS
jgi:hypothetical protein